MLNTIHILPFNIVLYMYVYSFSNMGKNFFPGNIYIRKLTYWALKETFKP